MRKLTQEEFEARVRENNQLVTVTGVYQKYDVNVECRCNFCGKMLQISPSNLISGKGCARCSKQRVADSQRKTTEQFISELRDRQPQIEVVGTYVGAHKPIQCLCRIHHYEFKATPTHLLNGETGCAFCIHKKLHEINATEDGAFKERMAEVNPGVEVTGEYYNKATPVSVRCRTCGFEWTARPDTLLIAHGCRRCCRSVGEGLIQEWLDNHDVDYECQKKYPDELRGLNDRIPLSYDFYLPDYNTLIEYQGQFHDGTAYSGHLEEAQVNRQKDNDNKKRQFAADKNIKLLEIWYYQRDQIPYILADLTGNATNP